jgi:hypothetical protein
MDLSTRSDVEAPIGYVFEQLSDFAGFEKAALRRGAEVVRVDTLEVAGRGAKWRASFAYAGKPRRMVLTLEDFDRPGHMRFDLESKNVTGDLIVDLHELSRGQTRVLVKIKIKPMTMTARVLVQTLRLAKVRTTKRLRERVGAFTKEIEERYQRPGTLA